MDSPALGSACHSNLCRQAQTPAHHSHGYHVLGPAQCHKEDIRNSRLFRIMHLYIVLLDRRPTFRTPSAAIVRFRRTLGCNCSHRTSIDDFTTSSYVGFPLEIPAIISYLFQLYLCTPVTFYSRNANTQIMHPRNQQWAELSRSDHQETTCVEIEVLVRTCPEN